MPQRAGIQLNARRFMFHRMARQVRVGMLIGGEPLNGDKPGLGQHAVIAAHRVALRLDIDIAFIAILKRRGAVQNAEVEGGEQFDLRQIGPGVASRRAFGIQHDDPATNRARPGFKLRDGERKRIHNIPPEFIICCE